MKSWRSYIENILVAVFLALLVRTFVLTGYKVPTSSMAPTLLPGDFIFAYRLPYGVKIPFSNIKIAVNPPQHGDVVVFSYPEQPQVSFVKRVVGLPGDRIQIENGGLIVNGQKLSYLEDLETTTSDVLNLELFKIVREQAPEGDRVLTFSRKATKHSFGPLIVPPNEVFLLGDNRDSSDDSRYWGTVPIEKVDGKVIWIWLSLNWQKKIWENHIPTVRWDRTWTGL